MADDVTRDSLDIGRVSELPHATVVDADVDRVELALSARLPLFVVPGDAAPDAARDSDLVLQDRQRTPIALLPADGSALRPLRVRHRGNSAQWDPAVRRTPADVRAAVDGERVLAVAFDALPTRGDIARTVDRAASGGFTTILWVALVGHGRRSTNAPTHPALTRAVVGSAREFSDATRVIPLAVPWAHAMPGALRLPFESADGATTLRGALALFGADEVVDARSSRDHDEFDALDAAEHELGRVVDALYPDASAREWGQRTRRDRHDQGTVVLFTGLSGSGKSTLAHALNEQLQEQGRASAVLDGDDVREQLSAGLGFDRQSRSINVRRIGYVAALIAEQGSVAIAAPIAPFAADRADVRARAERVGHFLLVHVSTPLAECERRDRKGLYARARAGEVPEFTGISSPYEAPVDADVTIDTSVTDVSDGVQAVLEALARLRSQ